MGDQSPRMMGFRKSCPSKATASAAWAVRTQRSSLSYLILHGNLRYSSIFSCFAVVPLSSPTYGHNSGAGLHTIYCLEGTKQRTIFLPSLDPDGALCLPIPYIARWSWLYRVIATSWPEPPQAEEATRSAQELS